MLNVKVPDCTIRKRLNKYGLFGRVADVLVQCLCIQKGKSVLNYLEDGI